MPDSEDTSSGGVPDDETDFLDGETRKIPVPVPDKSDREEDSPAREETPRSPDSAGRTDEETPAEDARPERGASEPPVGRVQLGEYVIEERIGAGGMGQVYRARQPSLDRQVALKVLPRSVAADKESVERFYREARNSARLVHANIVQIYTVGEDRGVPYFAMEYVEGEDLEHRMRRGEKFTIKEVIGVVASTVMALACAEERGIVHRDIKPGNLMVDTHGVVKVMDFGLAKAVKLFDTDITQAGFIVGTPTYMAPEQAEAMDVDHRTDIYSLGVVFYELLTGRPPFQSDDAATLIYMHVHREPEPPRNLRPETPEEVERVCLKCLAKKPGDRYQSATDLLADLLTTQDALSGGQDDGTIVYDVRMANLMVSSASTKKPPSLDAPVAAAQAAGPAAAAGAARVLSEYWTVVAGVGAAAIVTIVVILALLLWGRGDGEPVEGDAAAAVDSAGGEESGTGEQEASLWGLELSRLRDVLPPGSKVELAVGDRPAVAFGRSDLVDQEVAPGVVRVTASRPYYRTVEQAFAVRPGGIDPEFSAELFRLEPDTELAALAGRVESAMAAEDFAGAEKALAEVKRVDEGSERTKALEERLLAAQESRNEYWRKTHEQAEKLRAEGDFDKAEMLLEQMIAKLPPAHELYAAAQNSLAGVKRMKKEVREGRVRMETLLREGRLEEVRAVLDGLVKDLGVPPEQLGKLPATIEKAANLAYQAEVALAGRSPQYTTARARLKELVKITTESREYRDRLDEVSEIIQRTAQAEQVVQNVEDQIDEEDFEGAKRSLGRLREVDPRNRRLTDLEHRVRQGDAEFQVGSLLRHLASGLVSARGDVVASVIDLESAQFAEAARSSVASFAESGLRFRRSEYRLTKCELHRLGADERANAVVTWTFDLDVPFAGRVIEGVQDLKVFLRRRPEGWRVTAVEPLSKAEASVTAVGDGAGIGLDARIQGRVVAVDETILTIDRGSKHGVEVKMMFTIFRDARVIRLPLVSRGDDDTEAVVVVEEERLGEARVVEVRETQCLALFLPPREPSAPVSGRPAPGMLAVRAPLCSVNGSVPAVLGLRADRASAPMGSPVRLTADTRNVDDLPCYYRFETDGGSVRPLRSCAPRAEWLAPHSSGEYTVSVTLVSPLGVESREIKLRSEGAAAASGLVPSGRIDIGAPYQAVKDIAFDVAGDGSGAVYLLDERTRNLLVLSSEFELRSASRAYRGKPLRIAALRGQIYVLDAGARSVRRYDLGKDPFASPPGTSYGEPGVGNGKLRNPTAFALAANGEVAVLDTATRTVQVFAPNGRFLQSVGSSGGGVGGLQQPVGIVADSRGAFYVLDAGRRRVLIFRGGRYAGEFAVGEETSDLADIAYDSVGDRLLVLDSAKHTVTAYSTGGGRFAAPVVPSPPGGRRARGREARIGELSAPTRVVCDGASRLYVIGGERSEFIDRFDLPLKLDRAATPSGRLSSVAPTTFARLAAAPGGSLGLLDTTTGQVWEAVRGGWQVQSVGGRKIATPWSKAADIACDGRGDFYVLDPALATVHRLGRDGERVRFGKKGDTSKPENLAKPVAISATPPGAAEALATRRGRGVERVAVLLPERRFGIHVFGSDGAPKVHFPSEAASLHPSVSIAIGARGEVHAGSPKLIETFSASGALVRRTELEIDPGFLAASPDGTLYALDTRRRMVVGVDSASGEAIVKIQLPREIRSPADLAVDGFGRLYVLDGRARQIHVWRATGGSPE